MKKNIRLLVFVAVLVLATLACKAALPTAAPTPLAASPAAQAPQAAPVVIAAADMVQGQEVLTSLYERSMPGIVSIQVVTADGVGSGTGFVFDDQGHVVTNAHVVDKQTEIEVDFTSGYKAFGKLVGVDQDSDLAIIKVDAPAAEVKPLPLGDYNQLKVGQSVVAIGNPFGLNGTMTTGIISALGRTQSSNREATAAGSFSVADMIQTDAAINPGNSGGPLFNLNGEVIGVNRSIVTGAFNSLGQASNAGIGFAIPINLVRRVIPEIIKDGKYDYPYMGISSPPGDLPLDVINTLELKQYTGVYVLSVQPGSPAEKAGIIVGSKDVGLQGIMGGSDLIIAMDGQPINNFSEMMSYLMGSKSPGDTVILTVLRGDQKVDLTLVLGKRP
ncbi:MAG: PDZ domain-containing protein [Chloroflexi bacterium]|nr:MAG: PDZ domain-containing protein [Chloroflexota bacterium]